MQADKTRRAVNGSKKIHRGMIAAKQEMMVVSTMKEEQRLGEVDK